jgi:hypothetical protein
MWMAPSGQAETQCASLVQAPARTRTPAPSITSRQPWGQIEPHSPHAWQRSRRTDGTHFRVRFTLVARAGTKLLVHTV